jgi:hypothetical protein
MSAAAKAAPAASKSNRRTALLLAEYDTSADVVHAAEKVRDAGYSLWDTHTPFPVHGMDRAMGLKDSRLGWIVIACALTGLTGAYTMMYWMNGVDYRLVIGGKPPDALPSMVPILFELTILLSAFGSVLGMFHLNKLPRHNHPVFESDRFRRASDDKFFLSIEAEDPKFNLAKTRALLDSTHPANVEVIEEDMP